jgi:hypothetical protein
MANVTETANNKGFWKHLFVPLKIKVPVEATALVLIGILSFYVYQKEDHNNAAVPTLSQNSSSTNAKVTETPNVTAQSAAIGEKQTRSTQRASNIHKPVNRATATTGTDTVRTAAVSDNPLQGTAESRRSFPIPVQGIAAGSGLAGDVGMPRQRTFRLFPTERELPNLGEPVADYELYVRVGSRRGRDVETAANSAQKSGKSESSSSASESTKPSNLQSSSVLNVLWYTVRQEQYEQFKSELAAQATIESEIPIGIKEKQWSFRSDGPLYIKVTLLGPSE